MMKYLISHRLEIGLLFCLFGIQYSRSIMEIMGIEVNITNYFFIVGSLFLVGKIKNFHMNADTILLLIYQIMVVIWAFISNNMNAAGTHALSFTLFCIVMIVTLVTNRVEDFDEEGFVAMGWWSTGIFSIALCYIMTDGFSRFATIVNLEQGTDRLTLSTVAFAFLIFTLVYDKNTVLKKTFGIIFLIASVICVFICTRKGMTVSYLAVLLIHLFKNKGSQGIVNFFKKIFIALGVILLFLLLTKYIPAVSDLADNFVESVQSAIRGLLGYETDSAALNSNSGAIRNNNISNMWKIYRTQYTPIEVLFGRGYGYRQIDLPYLQAFTDMGIFMGIFYLVVQLIIPIRGIILVEETPAKTFAKYYTVMTIAQNIYSGVPYGQGKFAPIILLAFLMPMKRKKDVELKNSKKHELIEYKGWHR